MVVGRMPAFVFTVTALLSLSGGALAQQDERAILRTLNFQSGSITLADNLATLEQTENFRFLDNEDTQRFLTEVWGNPPGAGEDSLGMIFPTDADPLDDDGWAVIVSYEESGYVSDEDAGKIDYDELLSAMQEDTAEESKQREEAGYPGIELLGWAREPYYDAATKKLHWAKRLRFGGGPEETLNYNIRVLGRRGVLVMNIVADMRILPTVEKRVDSILAMTRFNEGSTYAEFDPSVDKAAAYGLAGLIAGGVLTKVGFFKGLLVFFKGALVALLAFKKAIAAAVVGGLVAIRALVKKLRQPKSTQQAS